LGFVLKYSQWHNFVTCTYECGLVEEIATILFTSTIFLPHDMHIIGTTETKTKHFLNSPLANKVLQNFNQFVHESCFSDDKDIQNFPVTYNHSLKN